MQNSLMINITSNESKLMMQRGAFNMTYETLALFYNTTVNEAKEKIYHVARKLKQNGATIKNIQSMLKLTNDEVEGELTNKSINNHELMILRLQNENTNLRLALAEKKINDLQKIIENMK